MTKKDFMEYCVGCGVAPGEPHTRDCHVERCSVCGMQKLTCEHDAEHDVLFARWTGFWPGHLEAQALGIDLNMLYTQGWHERLFVKPKDNYRLALRTIVNRQEWKLLDWIREKDLPISAFDRVHEAFSMISLFLSGVLVYNEETDDFERAFSK